MPSGSWELPRIGVWSGAKGKAGGGLKRQAWYLSEYLSKEDFERYYFSGGWVFPGWIGFSKWVKKEFGAYPKRELLIRLGGMSNRERLKDTWLGLYLWDTEKKKEGKVCVASLVHSEQN